MILLQARALSLVVLAAAPADPAQATSGRAPEPDARSEAIRITRTRQRPSSQGSAQYFTGSVRIEPLFDPKSPSRTSGGSVTFEPGARTAWHTHPLGQTLIVTAGTGRVQRWGDPVEEIRSGDVVRTPPRQKHWHGASPTAGMTHIAIQEYSGGKSVDWMEQVSDEQYKTPVTPAPSAQSPMPVLEDVRMVAPALEKRPR